MGGIYGGYRFDGALKNILSLEAFAKWGKFSMSERDCCADVHYWLGADGVRYNSSVLNMNGWDYSDLMSKIFMQQYGLQLNVNVLGFFNATRQSRWTLEVSPLLAAVGTKADVVSKIDGASAIDGASRWHLGVGGNVQAAYKMTGNLSVGIYSGMTYMTGKAMDGMPELHNTNYVWESGVKIGLKFGKRNRKEIPHQVRDDVEGVRDDVRAVVAPVVVETPIVKPEVTVCPEETAPATEIREEKPVEQTAVVEEISQSDLSQSSGPDQVRNDVEGSDKGTIVVEPAVEPAAEPVAELEAEREAELEAERVVERVVEREAERVAERVVERVAERVVERVVESAAEPAVEPAVEPEAEPADTIGHADDSSVRHPALDAGSAEGTPLPIIYFEFRTKRISWSELPKVEQIASVMKANPDMKIEVIGWADYRGDANYNMVLSEDRAKTIRQCLVNLGVASDRITVKGMGVDVSEDVDTARRVECVIVE